MPRRIIYPQTRYIIPTAPAYNVVPMNMDNIPITIPQASTPVPLPLPISILPPVSNIQQAGSPLLFPYPITYKNEVIMEPIPHGDNPDTDTFHTSNEALIHNIAQNLVKRISEIENNKK